jgi:hypothetical protein
MSIINNTLLLADEGGGVPEGAIERSLRFRRSASPNLARTPSTAGNRRTATFSAWTKISAVDTSGFDEWPLLNIRTGIGFPQFDIQIGDWNTASPGDPRLIVSQVNPDVQMRLISNALFRDPSAWYHIVVAFDTTQATDTNRVKVYVNGQQITSFLTATYPSQNLDTNLNATLDHYIGAKPANSLYFDGYLTEINFVDGQALTPSSFGETDALTGVWKPKKYAGTYGTNGFYLNFKDNASTSALGTDYSGNGNNWTTNNISLTAGATYDSMIDVPTPYADGGNGRGNYAVLNPLDTGGVAPTSGNLRLIADAAERGVRSTFSVPSSGLFYAEFLVGTNQSGATDVAFGLAARTTTLSSTPLNASNVWAIYCSATAQITRNGSSTTAGAGTALVAGDVLQLAVDLANSKAWIGKNNTWFNGSTGTDGNPSTGSNPTFTFSNPPELFVLSHAYLSTIDTNFGQRPFAYTPPTGFKALNTQNLPEPVIAKGDTNFSVVLASGANIKSTAEGVYTHQLAWIKDRANSNNHQLIDSVRGTSAVLQSNTTAAETTYSTPSGNSVGWVWSAPNTAVTNTAGSITSTVSANPTAGFSIVTYTGNGSSTASVGHGLGVAPAFLMCKKRNGSANWNGYHSALGKDRIIYLSLDIAPNTSTSFWGSSGPSSSVINFTADGGVNSNGDTYVCYAFSEVAGYSRFGSYTGNGSADGPFVFCGFRPRWVMVKVTNTTNNWLIWDSSRNTVNVVDKDLRPNLSNAESTEVAMDFVSNGFKIRATSGGWNGSGNNYIFMAFAESPFRNALAR